MSHQSTVPVRVFAPHLQIKKENQIKIVGVTAYDFSTARCAELGGADFILVGDSVATVLQGKKDTLSVTLDQMCYHCEIVARVTSIPLIVGDLPFMSYQVSPEDALRSSGRLVQEGGVGAVKLEGGVPHARTIEKIVSADIPVMGHVGLTPQSINRLGGFKVQGKHLQLGKSSRASILADAKAVQEAGAFAVVLEGVPTSLAEEITGILRIPTIGIGAGLQCDGQILVMQDLLGMIPRENGNRIPKFVKQYASLGELAQEAVKQFAAEVRESKFPTAQYSYIDSEEKCVA
jgi:3-methyl-2-oxobutanoate hydroxymethyltransferase